MFNAICRKVNPKIPIKYYKYQCSEHTNINGMWYVLYIPDPFNQENKWDLLLNQYTFLLEYVEQHINSLKGGYDADQYVIQNLACSRE